MSERKKERPEITATIVVQKLSDFSGKLILKNVDVFAKYGDIHNDIRYKIEAITNNTPLLQSISSLIDSCTTALDGNSTAALVDKINILYQFIFPGRTFSLESYQASEMPSFQSHPYTPSNPRQNTIKNFNELSLRVLTTQPKLAMFYATIYHTLASCMTSYDETMTPFIEHNLTQWQTSTIQSDIMAAINGLYETLTGQQIILTDMHPAQENEVQQLITTLQASQPAPLTRADNINPENIPFQGELPNTPVSRRMSSNISPAPRRNALSTLTLKQLLTKGLPTSPTNPLDTIIRTSIFEINALLKQQLPLGMSQRLQHIHTTLSDQDTRSQIGPNDYKTFINEHIKEFFSIRDVELPRQQLSPEIKQFLSENGESLEDSTKTKLTSMLKSLSNNNIAPIEIESIQNDFNDIKKTQYALQRQNQEISVATVSEQLMTFISQLKLQRRDIFENLDGIHLGMLSKIKELQNEPAMLALVFKSITACMETLTETIEIEKKVALAINSLFHRLFTVNELIEQLMDFSSELKKKDLNTFELFYPHYDKFFKKINELKNGNPALEFISKALTECTATVDNPGKNLTYAIETLYQTLFEDYTFTLAGNQRLLPPLKQLITTMDSLPHLTLPSPSPISAVSEIQQEFNLLSLILLEKDQKLAPFYATIYHTLAANMANSSEEAAMIIEHYLAVWKQH